MLVISIFFFSHNFFQKLFPQGHLKLSLHGKGIKNKIATCLYSSTFAPDIWASSTDLAIPKISISANWFNHKLTRPKPVAAARPRNELTLNLKPGNLQRESLVSTDWLLNITDRSSAKNVDQDKATDNVQSNLLTLFLAFVIGKCFQIRDVYSLTYGKFVSKST